MIRNDKQVASLLALFEVVDRATAWLDGHRPRTDAELTARVLKVAEETGEAAQAWIGALGQNPRKGVTHSRVEVAGELADVVMAALVAITSLGLDPAAALAARTDRIATRLPTTTDEHQPGGFLRQDVPTGLALPHHRTHATSTPSASSTQEGGGDAAIVGAEQSGWSR